MPRVSIAQLFMSKEAYLWKMKKMGSKAAIKTLLIWPAPQRWISSFGGRRNWVPPTKFWDSVRLVSCTNKHDTLDTWYLHEGCCEWTPDSLRFSPYCLPCLYPCLLTQCWCSLVWASVDGGLFYLVTCSGSLKKPPKSQGHTGITGRPDPAV